MIRDEMPLSSLVDLLKERGWNDVSPSKLQYYKDLGIIQTVSAFPKSKHYTYSLKDVTQRLKQVRELKKQGKSLTEIALTVQSK